jgi:hypothetical protein
VEGHLIDSMMSHRRKYAMIKSMNDILLLHCAIDSKESSLAGSDIDSHLHVSLYSVA